MAHRRSVPIFEEGVESVRAVQPSLECRGFSP